MCWKQLQVVGMNHPPCSEQGMKVIVGADGEEEVDWMVEWANTNSPSRLGGWMNESTNVGEKLHAAARLLLLLL